MDSSTMAQFNVRMAMSVKRAGDATLERASITPTQLVRAIWAKLAMGAEALDQLVEALAKDPLPHGMAADEPQRGDYLVEQIARRQRNFEQAVDLDASTYVPLSDTEVEDFLLQERIEREQERMVWHAE